ncbi:MAG: hypothetical protein PHG04_02815 [Candidatus Nanoarchaeia archaeon]|nr:hypothetical protein [Candidatus Nanoarchaeia archaeon]MDD5054284.1 hypothetical protein [Candidatus Nanoarchaeia archaeon]
MQIIANNISEISIKIETEEQLKLEKIQNNVMISDLRDKKNGFMLLKCKLLTKYTDSEDKPLGQFLIGEDLVLKGDEKEIEDAKKEWEKTKKLTSKMEKELLTGINTICIYDMQFFTNKMRFPPSTGFNFEVKKEQAKKKK